MKRKSPDFNVSWIVAPAAFVFGIVFLVAFPDAQGRLGGVAWGLIIAIPLVSLLAVFRVPVIRRTRLLRASNPHAIVELGERGPAMSKDIEKLNASDGLDRDARFRTVCVVIDGDGLSVWRATDATTPEWALSWDRLGAPTVGTVKDSFLGSGSTFRGLEFPVSTDGAALRLRVVFLGAGFLGLFALSRSELDEIAATCTRLRDAALASDSP